MSKITIDEMSDSLKNHLSQQTANAISEYVEDKLSKKNNTKYSTENGIKEFSCEDGYVDNTYMEGKTLVNISKLGSKSWNTELNDGIRTRFVNKYRHEFNPRGSNGTFTLFNYTDKTICFPTYTTEGAWGTRYDVSPNSSVIATLDENSSLVGVDFRISNGWSQSDFDLVTGSMFMVLEGDHTDKPIRYFEGLKSVGQGDIIDVLTYNKSNNNLIKDTFTYTKDMVINYSNGELRSAAGHYACDNYIEIEPSTDYMFVGINGNRAYYDENKQVVPPINNTYLQVLLDKTNGSKKNFTIEKSPSNARFIRITIHKDNLVDGKAYLYKSSNYDHKKIPHVLRSLPNGVKDTIEEIGNKYYKIQRCEEIVLNGSENDILLERTGTNTLGFVIKGVLTSHKNTWNSILSDKFKVQVVYQQDLEGVQSNTGNPTWIHIGINKTELATQDLNGFRAWLQSNPITVVYELETPQIIELPNFNTRTYEGDTTLLLNTGSIQGECEFEVTNNIGSEIEVLKDKVSDLDDLQIHEHDYQKYKLTSDIGTTINAGSYLDANDLTEPGFYRANIGKNIPHDTTYFFEVFRYSESYVLQRATPMNGDMAVYIRRMNQGVWESWYKIAVIAVESI